MSFGMGDGNQVSGGDAGPATSGLRDRISGGVTVGDYYGRNSQPARGQNNQLLILGGLAIVALLLLKR